MISNGVVEGILGAVACFQRLEGQMKTCTEAVHNLSSSSHRHGTKRVESEPEPEVEDW